MAGQPLQDAASQGRIRHNQPRLLGLQAVSGRGAAGTNSRWGSTWGGRQQMWCRDGEGSREANQGSLHSACQPKWPPRAFPPGPSPHLPQYPVQKLLLGIAHYHRGVGAAEHEDVVPAVAGGHTAGARDAVEGADILQGLQLAAPVTRRACNAATHGSGGRAEKMNDGRGAADERTTPHGVASLTVLSSCCGLLHHNPARGSRQSCVCATMHQARQATWLRPHPRIASRGCRW